MKKVISILLICAMLLSFGITIAAEESGSGELQNTASDTVVYKGARMTADQLNPDPSNGGYDWGTYGKEINGTISCTDGYSESQFTGNRHESFTIAHDGDYLYINTVVHYNNTGNRKDRSVNFIYIDFTDDEGNTVDYVISAMPMMQPYAFGSSYPNVYESGCTDREATSGLKYGNYGIACNKKGALSGYGIVAGRYADIANGTTQTNTTNYDACYNFVLPLDESVRTAIANGTCTMRIGYMYIQFIVSTGGGYWYTNCGNDFYNYAAENNTELPNDPSSDPDAALLSWWNAYHEISDNLLQTVTLSGATAEGENPVATTTATDIAGVQMPTASGDTVRLVGTLNVSDDFAKYNNVGFNIKSSRIDAPVPVTSNSVFKTCIANGSTEPSWWYGGDYFYFADITGIKSETAYELEVQSFYTNADGTTVEGKTYTLSIAADGTVTLKAAQ